MLNTAYLRIESGALRSNLAAVRARCPRSQLMAMVKADGYGHGLIAAARAFGTADALGVARLSEALSLREGGIQNKIVLMATLLDVDDVRWCSQHRVDIVVHDQHSLNVCLQVATQSRLGAWLKLDSGLHRAGFAPGAFAEADARLKACPGVTELVHMAHLSAADAPDVRVMNQQIDCFQACHSANSTAAASLANSAAILRRPDIHADWVRPGILLYGCNPFPDCQIDVRPAMTLAARVIAVREIRRGDSVGYFGTWTAKRNSRIATIGVGYGDGYPRHAPSGTPVLVNGQLATLVGRVSMDSLAADVTRIGDVKAGDEAILWGSELSPAKIAEFAGTISNALLTSITSRVERHHL